MQQRLKADALAGAVVTAMIVVILLGILQYRWSAQVIDATGMRLADTLQLSLVNWHSDFLRNFSEICLAMRGDLPEDATDPAPYAGRVAEWRATARYPELLRGVYAVASGATSKVRRLDRFDADAHRLTAEPGVQALMPALHAGDAVQSAGTAVGVPGAVRGWYFDPDVPALLHRAGPDWILIDLSADVIRSRMFGDLAHRYFQGIDGLDYEVSVVAGGTPPRVLYTSDATFGQEEVTDADGILNVFGGAISGDWPLPIRVFHPTLQASEQAGLTAVSWFPGLGDSSDADPWRLVVRHRRGGSLGAFMSQMRRRDVAAGFGALSLLVISIGMLIAASSRAQRLARLQLDFVTAVSHELRTPLTVITSAADNLEQGVVQGQEQLTQYGNVIGNQARQLTGLVEEILLFAATSNGRPQFNLQPLEVSTIIDATLSSTEGLVRAAGFTVERDVPRDLPLVAGDLVVLTQVLQNLITNALKYSVEPWVGIRASLVKHGQTGREIQVSVTDRGAGIAKADLSHIFEPFYRSPAVASAQIHGTGLGLTLARRMVEAMNGKITVESTEGKGSTFTVHLPCAAEAV